MNIAMTNTTRAHPSVQDELRAAESNVRDAPAAPAHRWTLFQWLCIARDWKRALQQLQVYGQFDPSSTSIVHMYRDLVRAEYARLDVLSGAREPDYLFDDVPDWMRSLHAALQMAASGDIGAADSARETALDAAPLVSGAGVVERSDANPARTREAVEFSWIGDSDSRLGPVCEFIAAGRYRWIALDDIARWRVSRPATLIDLVWTPCTLTLHDATTLHGFMPVRYPEAAPLLADEGDALPMARKTIWRDIGRTGVIASGAKTWTTSAGDFGLLELADCTFGKAPADTARPGN